MKKFKKLIATAIALCMTVAMVPMTVFAADDVAKIGDTTYSTLQAAVDAVEDGTSTTITLLKSTAGKGVKIPENKKITIDFDGYTYSLTEGVGSSGTETNGFQLLKDSTIILKDGTLKVDSSAKNNFYILIQNYADLTLDDMKLDGTNLDKYSGTDGDSYTLSNNNGNTIITGKTNIIANDDGDLAYAFDVCYKSSYPSGTTVTIDENMTGTITGNIEISSNNTNKTSLNVESGTVDGVIVAETTTDKASVKIVGGTFSSDVSDYVAEDSKLIEEDGEFVVKTDEEYEDYVEENGAAKIGNKKYATLEDAVKSITDDTETTIKLLRNSSGNGIKIPSGRNITIDFNGYTYTVNGHAEGSEGTKSQGMQLLKDSVIVLKDGKLKAVDGVNVKVMINNYADLTLEDMVIDGRHDDCIYGVSNNYGKLLVTGDTDILVNDDADFALDVFYYTAGGYDSAPEVTIDTTGTIDGDIQVGSSDSATEDGGLKLEIKDGTFTGELITYGYFEDEDEAQDAINVESGSFEDDSFVDYMDEDSVLIEKNGNFVVMTEDEYDDYVRSRRRSSYSLNEKKSSDRDDRPVVVEPEEELIFVDVDKTNPYYNAIMEVYEKGWMAGMSADVFAPNGTLTRGMAAQILWNMAGNPEPASVAPFTDVTSDVYYAKAVAWAYEQGIVVGYNGLFTPDAHLTMEQFEIMMANLEGLTPAPYTGNSPFATRGWVASRITL